MEFRLWLIAHVDSVLFIWLIVSGIAFAGIILWNKYYPLSPAEVRKFEDYIGGLINNTDGKKLVLQVLKMRKYVLFLLPNIFVVCGIGSIKFWIGITISILSLCVVYIIINFKAFIILCFSNIRDLLLVFIVESLFLSIFYAYILSPLSPSKAICFMCFLGCAVGIYFIRSSMRVNKRFVYFNFPTVSQITLVCMQSVNVLAMFLLGGYILTEIFGYREFAWMQWIQTLLFYKGDILLTFLRVLGYIILVFLLLSQAKLIIKSKLKLKFGEDIKKVGSCFLFVSGLVSGTIFLSTQPNYLLQLPISLKTDLEVNTGFISGAESYSIDNESIAYYNGESFYLDPRPFSFPESANISIRVISDFSDQAFFRFYVETVHDGFIKIWAENQGGRSAKNVLFSLSDSEGELSEHFSEEILISNIEQINPKEKVCLFTLRNEDMLFHEYNEVPIELFVTASFECNGRKLKLTKEIMLDTMISMRGITVDTPYLMNPIGTLLTKDTTMQYTKQFESQKTKLEIGRMYCMQTTLIEVSISINYIGGEKTILKPFAFIYEVP